MGLEIISHAVHGNPMTAVQIMELLGEIDMDALMSMEMANLTTMTFASGIKIFGLEPQRIVK